MSAAAVCSKCDVLVEHEKQLKPERMIEHETRENQLIEKTQERIWCKWQREDHLVFENVANAMRCQDASNVLQFLITFLHSLSIFWLFVHEE